MSYHPEQHMSQSSNCHGVWFRNSNRIMSAHRQFIHQTLLTQGWCSLWLWVLGTEGPAHISVGQYFRCGIAKPLAMCHFGSKCWMAPHDVCIHLAYCSSGPFSRPPAQWLPKVDILVNKLVKTLTLGTEKKIPHLVKYFCASIRS